MYHILTMSTIETLRTQLDNVHCELHELQVENKRLRVQSEGEAFEQLKEMAELRQQLHVAQENEVCTNQNLSESHEEVNKFLPYRAIYTQDNQSVLLSYCSHAYNCIAALTYTKCNIKSKQTCKTFEFKREQGLITATKNEKTRSMHQLAILK